MFQIQNFRIFKLFDLILEVTHQSLTLMDTDFGQSLSVYGSHVETDLHSVPDTLLDFN